MLTRESVFLRLLARMREEEDAAVEVVVVVAERGRTTAAANTGAALFFFLSGSESVGEANKLRLGSDEEEAVASRIVVASSSSLACKPGLPVFGASLRDGDTFTDFLEEAAMRLAVFVDFGGDEPARREDALFGRRDLLSSSLSSWPRSSSSAAELEGSRYVEEAILVAESRLGREETMSKRWDDGPEWER